MELTKQQLLHYKQTADSVFQINESGDSIIPDSLTDAQRIIDAYPIFMIREKQARQDAMSIKMNISVNVLYLSEDGSTVNSVTIPLTATVSDTLAGITPTSELMCKFSDCNAQARLINSRKISVTATCQMRLKAYDSARELLTSEISGEGSNDCQCLWNEFQSVETQTAVSRNFSVNDEITLATSDNCCGLLRAKASISPNEVKVVNSKVVMKGEIKLDALMNMSDGKLETVSATVPFTQISDVSNASESAKTNVEFSLRSMEIEPIIDSSQNGRYLVSMGICADILQSETVNRKVLSDIYSVKENLSVETSDFSYIAPVNNNDISVPVNESFELGTVMTNLIDADIIYSDVIETLDDMETVIPVMCNLLYSDETGQPQATARRIYVKTDEPVSGKYNVESTQPKVLNGTDGSVSVMFKMMLKPASDSTSVITQIDDIKSDGELPMPTESGIMLLRIRPTDTLWDIGKRYRVPLDTIKRANETEGLPKDRTMLIIPIGRT